jgi:predicted transcriptional regulator of viral defense system
VRKTLGRALIEAMAAEQRRVVADWRALLLLRRATDSIPEQERRWSEAPLSVDDVHAILNRLVAAGDFRRVQGVSNVYEALAPYARGGGLEEEEVLMEVHPFAALSHVTAFVFHNLTEDFPQGLHLVLPSDSREGLSPTGVQQGEWRGEWPVPVRKPDTLFGKPVYWHRLNTAPAELGTVEYRPRGYPVRVTTPERSLLDGLQHPEWCGGFGRVQEAWVRVRDTLDIEALVGLVDAMGVGLLRQRAGFVMETLGIQHPRLSEWASQAKRGGSSRLVGSEPFATLHDERWKLSINAPIDTLREATS